MVNLPAVDSLNPANALLSVKSAADTSILVCTMNSGCSRPESVPAMTAGCQAKSSAGAAAGTTTFVPHCLHLVGRPANSSGTRYCLRQPGQAKAILMAVAE